MDQTLPDDYMLNIAATCVGTKSLGPGWRSAVWVQGCQLRCRGCVAPEWIPQVTARLVRPIDLAEDLLRDPKIVGITISGGEPMLQAKGLSKLVEALQDIRPVNIICFSGYRYEWLKNQPDSTGVRAFLDRIDLLIDGPYIDHENNNVGLRGSKNQRFIHMTNKLSDYEFESQPRKIEVHVEDGQLLMVGVPPHSVKTAIDGSLDRMESLKLKRGKYVWS